MTAKRSPQAEDHSAGLEERDLVVGLLGAAPPERLVKGPGAGEVPHSEGHETDPLFHRPSMALARGEQLFGSARTNVGAGHIEKGEDDDVAAQGGERDRLSRWPVD